MNSLKIFLIILVFFFSFLYAKSDTKRDIKLALITSIESEYSKNSLDIINGVKLYVDNINANGGLKNKEIILDIYDDKNRVTTAIKEAKNILESNALAVIGHNSINISSRTARLYENNIVSISPSINYENYIKTNKWYFSKVNNASTSGEFLAQYTKYVINPKKIAVINDFQRYGFSLANGFSKKAKDLDLNIVFEKSIFKNSKRVDAYVRSIIKNNKIDLVFLAVDVFDGIKIVKKLKQRGYKGDILVPDNFDSKIFLEAFKNDKKALNNIIIGTPFTFPTANKDISSFFTQYKKIYGTTPSWRSFYGYDSARTIVEILKDVDLKKPIKDIRVEIKNRLNQKNQVSFYDDEKMPFLYEIGHYRKNLVYPKFIQIKEVYKNSNQIRNKVKLPSVKNIVYTGIELNEIKNLDMDNMTYDLDFYIWFRYGGRIDFKNITFLNSDEPIVLGKPLKEKKRGTESYKLFHIKGKFKSTVFLNKYFFNKNIINLAIIHKKDMINEFQFIVDNSMQNINKLQVLNPSSGWSIKDLHLYEDVLEKNSLGDIDYLNKGQETVEFSKLNLEINLKKNILTLRGTLSKNEAIFILFSLIIILISLYVLKINRFLKKHLFINYFLQFIFLILFLIAFEVYIVQSLSGLIEIYEIKTIVTGFSILWWVLPAIYINRIIRHGLWVYLEKKTEKQIPQILKGFTSFIVYLLTLFAIVANVFEQELTSLLATSGVVAMIVGLAMQTILSNIFSGIALNIERPFRTGDWVKIKDLKEGKVIDISWRTTKIQMRNNSIISVPNSMVTDNLINNMTYPYKNVTDFFTININQNYNIERVKKVLLDAAFSSNEIDKSEEPWVSFKGIEKSNGMNEPMAVYAVGYTLKDFADKFTTRSDVWYRVTKHLSNADIKYHKTPLFKHSEEVKNPASINRSNELFSLDCIYLFDAFSAEDKVEISKNMIIRHLDKGDILFEQNSEAGSMFIVVEGTVSIEVDIGIKTIEVARLGVSDILGEMGLLTGEKRTATAKAMSDCILYEINKDPIKNIIDENPLILRRLSYIISERKVELENKKNQGKNVQELNKNSYAGMMFRKLKRFLNN